MSNDNQLDSDLPYEYKIDYVSEQERARLALRRVDLATGRGDAQTVFADTFMGYNHRIAPSLIPKNREHGGYTFFTRPDLLLNARNLEAAPRLKAMSEAGRSSAELAILGTLDPMCEFCTTTPANGLGMDFHPEIPFDNRQAFIPVLTNRLLSLQGFPDNTLDVYTSEEGLKREQWSSVDSHYAANYTFSLNATFANMDGDVTTQFFTTWLEAMSAYYSGDMVPRFRNMIQREKNYETRIYRLLMDPTLTYVTKIGAANACIPLNDNLGAVMNYDSMQSIVDSNDQINIQFHCQGAIYLDPRLITDFNKTVMLFNPDMVEAENNIGAFTPRGNLRRLKKSEVQYFNWYGYPHIDLQTRELSWFVYEDMYQKRMAEVNG